jgi:hypothetical protein
METNPGENNAMESKGEKGLMSKDSKRLELQSFTTKTRPCIWPWWDNFKRTLIKDSRRKT